MMFQNKMALLVHMDFGNCTIVFIRKLAHWLQYGLWRKSQLKNISLRRMHKALKDLLK